MSTSEFTQKFHIRLLVSTHSGRLILFSLLKMNKLIYNNTNTNIMVLPSKENNYLKFFCYF